MPSVNDVATPAVLIDVDVLERNIARMAERARAAGVRLRPHGKTHKLLEVGRLQLGSRRGRPVAREDFGGRGLRGGRLRRHLRGLPVVGEDKGRRLLRWRSGSGWRWVSTAVEGARTLATCSRRPGGAGRAA